MPEALSKSRRTIDYQTLNAFLKEAEQLAGGSFETVGNWSFAQILYHLTTTIKFSLDGFPFQSSWILRATVGRVMKKRILGKPMPSGFKLPKSARALVPPVDVELSQILPELRSVLDRFASAEEVAAHPIFGKFTKDEWELLHRRHAAMHMGFVIPKCSSSD